MSFRMLALLVGLMGFSVAAGATAPRTMVHLFNWTWNDIARECETVLGPTGYDAVQVSPPMEHAIIPGRSWYERYQPVSFRLESRSGTESEFQLMIARCDRAGVSVIVDAVLNHMAWRPERGEAVGSGGTRYGNLSFPHFAPVDFHRCRQGDDLAVRNYHDRWEVQNCEIAILPDLATESPRVQKTQREFLERLVALGVKGFRIDAAKHMPAADVEAMVASVKDHAFVFSEIIGGHHEAIKAVEYYASGHVTEFVFSEAISSLMRQGRLADLRTLHQWRPLIPSEKAVVFVDNHDNQRGHGSGGDILTHTWSDAYKLANLFMLAFNYGTPSVMSSYAFSDPNAGPPQTDRGELIPALSSGGECQAGWVCEHRWLQMRNAVKLRSRLAPETPVVHWFDNGSRLIAFGRGTEAFIVINGESYPVIQTIQTGLPPGAYCNRYHIEWNASCSHPVIVDASGSVSVTVPPFDALLLSRL
jgi:alpha-amylase